MGRAGPAGRGTRHSHRPVIRLTAESWLGLAAGWVGVVLFGVAVYAAVAAELEEVRGRPVLPTARRAKGRLSVEGSLLDQVLEVQHEPGVRRQL